MRRSLIIWSLVLVAALLGLPGPLLAGLALFATCLCFAMLEAQPDAAPTRRHRSTGVLRA